MYNFSSPINYRDEWGFEGQTADDYPEWLEESPYGAQSTTAVYGNMFQMRSVQAGAIDSTAETCAFFAAVSYKLFTRVGDNSNYTLYSEEQFLRDMQNDEFFDSKLALFRERKYNWLTSEFGSLDNDGYKFGFAWGNAMQFMTSLVLGNVGGGSSIDDVVLHGDDLLKAGYSLDDLSAAANVTYKGSDLTVAGRALAKHGGRPGSVFPRPTGSPSDISNHANQIVGDILNNQTKMVRGYSPTRQVSTIEIYGGQYGGGLSYDYKTGELITFLEPPR